MSRFLNFNVRLDFERSTRNSNVRPEIRMFDWKFQLPPDFSNVPIYSTINVFPDLERSTGNANVRPVATRETSEIRDKDDRERERERETAHMVLYYVIWCVHDFIWFFKWLFIVSI